LGHRDYADVAISQARYLPHTWAVPTLLFLLGWPTVRVLLLGFPLYLQLLFKRTKVFILPFAVFAVCGLAELVRARLRPTEGLKRAKGSVDTANAWTLYDFTCMRRLLTAFIHNSAAVTAVMWLVWFGLFGACARFIKGHLAQLAALLLLSLLPMYHQKYDLAVAVPALAICLGRCSLANGLAG
jgi:hypothetical protein